jgi:hypothetical protein
VRWFPALADLPGPLVNGARTVAVVELEMAPGDCLRWLAARLGGTAGPAAIVVGSRQTAELEPLVRELGAAEFVLETVGGERLAQICRRQFQHQSGWAPPITRTRGSAGLPGHPSAHETQR